MRKPLAINMQNVSALILAGGRASRMQGQDKGLIKLGEYSLVAHVIQQLRIQIHQITISANRNQTDYARFGYPVIGDSNNDYAGPMAGILAGLQTCKTDWLLVCPCDAPFLPGEFAWRMQNRIRDTHTRVCMAETMGRLQPVHLLLHRSLRDSLQENLQQGKQKMQLWLTEQDYCTCDFSDQPEAFFNINTHADLQQATKQ